MDIFSGIIWLVIIGAFIYPFAKTVIQKQAPPPSGPRPVGGPRGVSESGGYEPSREARPDPRAARPEMQRTPPVEQTTSDTDTSIRRSPTPRPDAGAGSARVDAEQVRRQLRNPRSVRAAIVLREVLDRPVSMR